jgi:hypothetical protein
MLHLINSLKLKLGYYSMRKVNIFTVQRPVRNKTSVRVLSDAFGLNIPHYLPLEGGDYNGPQYLFCVDRNIDFEGICEKYKYRYYPAYKFEVEEEKYNNNYQIRTSYYNKEIPYRLEKYESSGYDSY